MVLYLKSKVTQNVPCKVKDVFDSGSNVSMIYRSALPKGIITKFLGDTKLVKTLTGHLKMQQIVMMRDLRLSEFDKTGTSNLLMVIFFDNDIIKYNIILSTNLLSKTGFKSNCSEGTWNGLITPSHCDHLEVWIRTNSMLWNAYSTSKSKMRSLIKIDSKSLRQRSWTPSIKTQM